MRHAASACAATDAKWLPHWMTRWAGGAAIVRAVACDEVAGQPQPFEMRQGREQGRLITVRASSLAVMGLQ